MHPFTCPCVHDEDPPLPDRSGFYVNPPGCPDMDMFFSLYAAVDSISEKKLGVQSSADDDGDAASQNFDEHTGREALFKFVGSKAAHGWTDGRGTLPIVPGGPEPLPQGLSNVKDQHGNWRSPQRKASKLSRRFLRHRLQASQPLAAEDFREVSPIGAQAQVAKVGPAFRRLQQFLRSGMGAAPRGR